MTAFWLSPTTTGLPRDRSCLSLSGTLESEERSFLAIDPVIEETKIDIGLAWVQGTFIDPRINREAYARLCIARKAEIQALITFDFWSSDLAACDAEIFHQPR
jgi:hypothetical protein